VKTGTLFLVFFQVQRRGVDAIPHSGRLWTVFKEVAQVRIAPAAFHLRPPHPVTCVRLRLHRLFFRRGIKTGPAGAGVVLCVGTKQGLAAANTLVSPRGLRIFVLSGERRFCSLLPGYIVLILRELFLPCRIVFADLFFHTFPCSAYAVIHPVQYQIQRTALKFHPRARILMAYWCIRTPSRIPQ
jgi:hypothetical protein